MLKFVCKILTDSIGKPKSTRNIYFESSFLEVFYQFRTVVSTLRDNKGKGQKQTLGGFFD